MFPPQTSVRTAVSGFVEALDEDPVATPRITKLQQIGMSPVDPPPERPLVAREERMVEYAGGQIMRYHVLKPGAGPRVSVA